MGRSSSESRQGAETWKDPSENAMSEAAAPEAPKKKGKLPIILALALVLGGGGFFMMKGKGEKKEEHKPTLVLAEKETEMEEFLTNTGNPSVYVKAKLSVRLTKEYTDEKFNNNVGDVRDAVLGVLNSTQPADITDASKRSELKHRLAEAMNTALEGPLEGGGEHGEHGDDAPKRKGKETEKPTEEASADWDSSTGPVLQVRFSSLATQ